MRNVPDREQPGDLLAYGREQPSGKQNAVRGDDGQATDASLVALYTTYGPPQSSVLHALDAEPGREPRGCAWRLYFWFCVATTALGASTAMSGSDPLDRLSGLLETAIGVMGLLGLQGHVYRRHYLRRQTWAVFGPIFVLWRLGLLAYAWPELRAAIGTIAATALAAGLLILQLPQFRALLRYGRRPLG